MPRSNKLRFVSAMVAILSALLLSATPEEPFNPLGSLPEGAVAIVSVGNPAALMVNTIGFLKKAGFEPAAKTLTDALGPLLSPAAGDESLDEADVAEQEEILPAELLAAMDPTRRFVAGLYPSDEKDAPMSLLMFVPLRPGIAGERAKELEEALLADAGEDDVAISFDYPGYMMLGVGTIEVPPYGAVSPTSQARAARLSGQSDSSVVVWIDPAIGKDLLDTIPGGLGDLLSEATAGDSDVTPKVTIVPSEPGSKSGPGIGVDNVGVDNTAPRESGSDEARDTAELSEAAGDDEATDDYAEDYSWDDMASAGGAETEAETEADAKADDTAGTDGLKQLGAAIDTGIAEIRALELVLTVREDRAWIRVGAELAPGGDLAKLAGLMASGDRTMPYLSYCEADALVSIAWSAPPDWASSILESLYGMILPDKEFLEASMASMRSLATATGMNGAASLDLSMTEELVQALRSSADMEDAEAAALLARGLGLQLSGAMELADRQSYRDAAAAAIDIAKSPAYAELMEESGLTFDVERKKGVIENLPYDAYSYSFSVPEDSPEADGAGRVLSIIGDLLAPVYVYKDDKAYLGLGDPAPVARRAVKDAPEKPLRFDRAFKSLRAGASPDTRALFYLSTSTLTRLAMRLLPEDQEPLAFNARNLSGFLYWFDATPGTMGVGVGVGAEDIKALAAVMDQ
ncbi:MAG: hypothetical protein JXM71_05530 [Spirochaetales bacterium]|nr:hypothetical protein [Spirochaetales bacterium]